MTLGREAMYTPNWATNQSQLAVNCLGSSTSKHMLNVNKFTRHSFFNVVSHPQMVYRDEVFVCVFVYMTFHHLWGKSVECLTFDTKPPRLSCFFFFFFFGSCLMAGRDVCCC